MKRPLFLLLLFVKTIQLTAQYDLIFQHTSDQVTWNTSDAIAGDASGNTWLAGHFENSIVIGPNTLTSVPSEHGSYVTTAFIGKYNSNTSTWSWMKKIALQLPAGSFNYSWINDIVIDNAGNVYLTGIYAGKVGFDAITLTSTKSGSQYTPDMFVAKYNAGGVVQWAKSFGSKNGMDSGNGIEIDATGNLYAAGLYTNKSTSCGEQYDINLIKLDNNGNQLWQKRYASNVTPCNGNNFTNDLALDATGNPHICGTFAGTVSFGTGSGMSVTALGAEDTFVAKINSSGVTQWVRAAGTTGSDQCGAVYVGTSGNVYTGGRINSNSFLTKYNSTGTAQWTVNPFPGSTTGNINNADSDLLVNDSKTGFLQVSAATGAVMNTDSILGYGVTGITGIKDVENAGSGFVFNVNVRCGYVNLENLTITASCTNACSGSGSCFTFGDIGMVRYAWTPPPPFAQFIPTHSGLTDEGEIILFPNPVKDELNISLPPGSTTSLLICDQYGRIIWKNTSTEINPNLSIKLDSRFQDGFYYLYGITNGKMSV
jgi:hypothetical protein